MLFHAIYLDNNMIVRPAVDGITEIEWLHGCRCWSISESQFQLKNQIASDPDFNLLTFEEWSNFISSLDDPGNVPNNSFRSTRVIRDKWDADRKVY